MRTGVGGQNRWLAVVRRVDYQHPFFSQSRLVEIGVEDYFTVPGVSPVPPRISRRKTSLRTVTTRPTPAPVSADPVPSSAHMPVHGNPQGHDS